MRTLAIKRFNSKQKIQSAATSCLVAVALTAGSAPCTPSAQAADLTLSAASSLTDAFKAVANSYEKKHPETHIVLNFAASDVLMAQILHGAPADVFASADQVAMDKAVKGEAVDGATRVNFAVNTVVLIVPADNPAKINKVDDLKSAEVARITYGNPSSVPVGRYTRDALTKLNLWDMVRGKAVVAENVRQALNYVSRGEVDAGFVFATDAASTQGKVRQIATMDTGVPVSYPVAVTRNSKNIAEAGKFIAFLRSPEGVAVMKSFGFSQP